MTAKNYIYYTDQEDRDLLNYVAEKSKEIEKPLALGHLWASYIEHSKTERSAKGLCSRFRDSLVPKLHEIEIFDLETKIKMLFATQYPVNEGMEQQIISTGFLELNHDRCIMNFKSFAENGLELTLIDKNGRLFRKSGRNLLGENTARKRKRRLDEQQFLGAPESHDLFDFHHQNSEFFYHHHNSLGPEEPLRREIKTEYQEDSMGYQDAPRASGIGISKPQSSTTSLKDFLKLLKTVVVSFEAPELSDLRENVADAIDGLGESDKQIPLNKIRLALETTLALVNG